VTWMNNGECSSYGEEKPGEATRAWHPTGEPDSSQSRHQFVTVSHLGIMSWDLDSGQAITTIKPKTAEPRTTLYAIDVLPSKNLLVASGGGTGTAVIEVYDLSTNRLKTSYGQPGGIDRHFTEVALLTHAGTPQALVDDTKKAHIFDLENGKKIATADIDFSGEARFIQDPFNPGVFLAAPFKGSAEKGGKISIYDARVKPVTAVRSLIGLRQPLSSLNISPTHHSPGGLVCGVSYREAKLWDLRSDKCLATITDPTDSLWGGEINQSVLALMAGSTIRSYDIEKIAAGDVAEPECEIPHSFCRRNNASVRWVSTLSDSFVVIPMQYLAVAKWAK